MSFLKKLIDKWRELYLSYDCSLVDPVSKEVITVNNPHFMQGGTYCLGGCKDLNLNVTYNYCKHYYGEDRLGEKGLRGLDGQTALSTISALKRTIDLLENDTDDYDYWNPTEGNSKRALCQLLTMAQMRPDGIWRIL